MDRRALRACMNTALEPPASVRGFRNAPIGSESLLEASRKWDFNLCSGERRLEGRERRAWNTVRSSPLPLGPHGKLPLILQEACPEDGPGAVQHVYLLELSPRTCTSELHACLWLTHGRAARVLMAHTW